MKHLAIVSALLLTLVACTDAERAHLSAYGGHQTVTLYSGGKAVRQWVATGQVSNEAHSDGYYFMDETTGKLVRISGVVVIERQ
jgi:hypothetical protein